NGAQQYQDPNAQYQTNGTQQYQQSYQTNGVQQQYQNPNMQYQQPKVGGLTKIASKLHMKPKTLIILGSILAVVVVAVIIIALNFSRISNAFKRWTSTDEEYLAYAIAENSSGFIEGFTSMYEAGLESLENPELGYEFGAEFELGEEGKNLLGMMSAVIGSAEKLGLQVNFGYADNMANLEGQVEVNGKKVISAQAVADVMNEQVYVGIPDIIKKWVQVPARGLGELSELDKLTNGDMSMASYYAYMTMTASGRMSLADQEKLEKALADFGDFLPDKKAIDKYSKKYLEIAAKGIFDGVTSRDTELRAGSVTEDVIEYKIGTKRISIVNYDKFQKDIYEELLEDDGFMDEFGKFLQFTWAISQIEKSFAYDEIFGTTDNIYSTDPEYLFSDAARDEMIAEFKSEIADELEDVNRALERSENEYRDRYEDEDEFVKFYIDGKGGFRGFEIQDGGEVYTYKAPLDGSDLGVRIAQTYEYKGEEEVGFAIEGEGTYSSGEINGTFSVYDDGKRIIDIGLEDFDLDALKDGELKGTVLISNPGEDAADNMMRSMRGLPNVIAGQILNYSIAIGFDISSGAAEYSLGIRTPDGDLATLTIEGKNTSVGKIKTPDEDDVINPNYLDSAYVSDIIDIDGIYDALDDAGVPSSTIDMVKQILDETKDMTMKDFVRYIERFF
ncbi:MAG: hypothetical protein MJ133_02325, partial [Lachnospiraceae bacterium]|nr:hypothetical protein [Lachnospiraceae bacterium]